MATGNVDVYVVDRQDDSNVTPLMLACAEGDQTRVTSLLAAGAQQDAYDSRGWTARDHAVYSGHIGIAKKLCPVNQDTSLYNLETLPTRTEQDLNIVEPLSTESELIITLGSMLPGSSTVPIDLEPYLASVQHNDRRQPLQARDTVFVRLTEIDSRETGQCIPLSFDSEERIDRPWRLLTKDYTNMKLMFQILDLSPDSEEYNSPIGCAIVLTSSLVRDMGMGRESLVREATYPILAFNSLKVLGTITFSFLIIKPLSFTKNFLSPPNLTRKPNHPPTIVGHRGIGQNIADLKELQLGENTIDSFQTAQNHGAQFVEFDVELTKDHVPVIYHDFLVAETGTDTPMHEITFEQFKYLDQEQTSTTARLPPPSSSDTSIDSIRYSRPRSRSLGHYTDPNVTELLSRMSLTHGYRTYKTKGNLRGFYIHQPFTTLQEMLTTLAPNLHFNMEIKYPLYSELVEWKLAAYHINLNTYVDTIVTTLYKHANQRQIIISSFSPEICIALRLKQSTYPILFLSDGVPVGDPRSDSLRAALRFAKTWNLAGLVMEAEPLILCPRLIRHVQEEGMICATYGRQNDQKEHVDVQVRAGVDVVITNQVKKICDHLGINASV